MEVVKDSRLAKPTISPVKYLGRPVLRAREVSGSSLFYLFWSVYGNNHHLNIGIIHKFPIPSENKLLEKEEKIRELSDKVNDALLGCFDKYAGRMGQFDTGKCKHIIDEVDDFLGELYGLCSEQVKYIQSYDNHIRK